MTVSEKVCERCGAAPRVIEKGPFAGQPELLDYCAECSRDLCDDCMAKGCCGHVPAISGEQADNDDGETFDADKAARHL